MLSQHKYETAESVRKVVRSSIIITPPNLSVSLRVRTGKTAARIGTGKFRQSVRVSFALASTHYWPRPDLSHARQSGCNGVAQYTALPGKQTRVHTMNKKTTSFGKRRGYMQQDMFYGTLGVANNVAKFYTLSNDVAIKISDWDDNVMQTWRCEWNSAP